jgi:hypothetical protein
MGGFFIMPRQLLILAAAALWPFSAQAADTPKEGSDKLMVRFVNVSSFSEMKQGEAVVYTNDNSGVQSAATGSAFNNLGVRCVGFLRLEGATGVSKGYCLKGDGNGNEYWEEYQDLGGKGTSKILGGKGKFAGMTGDIDYTYESVGDINGRILFVVSQTVRWNCHNQPLDQYQTQRACGTARSSPSRG